MTAARPVLYGDRQRWGLLHADALVALTLLPAGSVSAVVCDPPYGVSMSAWDGGALSSGPGFQTFSQAWARQALRVLRPGGHLLAFGAARTAARLSVGIEEAGFEVRDTLCWLYGSGVPKGRRLPGGLSSALKPAWEPVVLARKPLDAATPTCAGNLARHGTGVLNIEAARVIEQRAGREAIGRWPANVALGHDISCGDGCTRGCVVADIDRQYPGVRPSRYFYAAKASRLEREKGLERLPAVAAPVFAGSGRRRRRNVHPTVKPLNVMRWLVRLAAPASGVVLDPFAGSGSTGIAALLEGRQFLGIERDGSYAEIARRRIAHWAAVAVTEGVT